MIAYPVILTPDDNGTFLVTSPDFPEVTSFGNSIEDALERARGALLEAIEARIRDREQMPSPSTGEYMITLSTQETGAGSGGTHR